MTLLLLAVISTSSGDKVCSPNDPTSCRQTVTKGETVPFDGQLFTPRKAAKLAVQAAQCQERIDAAVEAIRAELGIDLKLQKQLRANDSAHATQTQDLLQKELERAHSEAERGFFESPVFWFSAGVGAAILVVIGAVAALDALRQPVVFSAAKSTSQGVGILQW